jgi:hypothetical protein
MSSDCFIFLINTMKNLWDPIDNNHEEFPFTFLITPYGFGSLTLELVTEYLKLLCSRP